MQEWFKGARFVLCGSGGTGKTPAHKFAAGQVEAAAWSSVRLVIALSGGSMARGYAGLLGESCHARRPCVRGCVTSGLLIDTLADKQKNAGQERRRCVSAARGVRQKVQEVLHSPGWSGRWLAMLDDLPAPADSWRRPGWGGWRGSFPGGTGGQSSRLEQECV